jgi:hypothetical protein
MEERVAESVFVTVVHCPVAPAGISPEQAADWQPGMFSLDKWGPELGLGVGGVGALSMYNLLGKYHKEKLLAEKEKLGQRQQQLDVEANALRPTLPSRLPQPVAFNA